MSEDNVRKEIETLLKANWNTTEIGWENSDIDALMQKDTSGRKIPFIKPDILFDENSNIAIGTKAQRITGLLQIGIFVGENTGSGVALVHKDTLSAIFKNKTVNGIHYRVPRVQKVGANDGWYQINFIVDFHNDLLT